MKCDKCNNEIREDSAFCPNCGKSLNRSYSNKNKTRILIVLGIIVSLCILAALIIIKLKNNNDKEVNQTKDFYQGDLQDSNQQIVDDKSLENYSTFNEEAIDTTVMPNLVGMTYKEAMDYIEKNGFYCITDIKCKYETTSEYGIKIPTTIKSTIPTAGTELDIYKENVITVLADYDYGVKAVEIDFQDDNFFDKYFGKTIKIQVGRNENSFIEGVVGKDFLREGRYNKSILKYTNKSKGKYVDLVIENKIAFFDKTELIEESIINHFVNGKVWIDNELIKDIKFGYDVDGMVRGSV